MLGATNLVVRDHGRAGVARVLGLGLVLHLGLAGVLLKLTAATPFVDDHLTLASLEANQLARVAALGGIGALWFTRQCRGLTRVVVAATTVLGFLIVFVTSSVTAVIGVAVALSVLAVHASRQRLAALALGLLLLLVALPLSGALRLDGSPAGPATSTISADEIQSFGGRSALWPEVLDLVPKSPITGIGLGNERAIIAELPIGWSAQQTHNLVLHLLLTTGLVGAGLLLAAVAGGLVHSVSAVEPFSMALMTFILIDGISEAVLRVPSFGWFGLCAAVLLATRRQTDSPPVEGSLADSGHRRQPVGVDQ